MVIDLIRFCVEITRLSKGVPKKLAEPWAACCSIWLFRKGCAWDAMLARFFTGT
jgi:hypothetical protein